MTVKKKNGYTLVEVVVAMLLTSIMVTSVFSVALTTKTVTKKGSRKLIAVQTARQLTGMLKNYVTGDFTTAGLDGPGPGTGPNSWSLDSLVGVNDTSCVNCYALTTGLHTVTGILPKWFEDPPTNAVLTYLVGTETVNGSPAPSVTVKVDWTD